MAGADGIDTHVLHLGKLTIHGVIRCGRTECTLIVMHAHAVELDSFSVQIKAGVTVKAEIPEAKLRVICVDDRTIHQKLCTHIVHSGRIGRPQLRFADNRLARRCCSCSCVHGHACFSKIRSLRSIRGINRIAHRDICGCIAVVFDCNFRADRTRSACDIRRCDLGAIPLHMYRIGGNQRHIAVNTAAGIPAAGRNVVDRLDSDDIFRAAVAGDIVTDIKGKRGIAIMVFTQLRAVDINICIRIYTVKIDDKSFSRIAFRQDKCLAIPACSTGQEAAFRLAGSREFPTDTEIVWQRHIVPRRIVKICTRGGAIVAQIEFPAIVKVALTAGGARRNGNSLFRTSYCVIFICKSSHITVRENHSSGQCCCDRSLKKVFFHILPLFFL